jgi:chaperonin GroES
MSKTTIKPLGNRVLVEPIESTEKTVGGIIIPDSAKEKQNRGTVIATGKGTENEKMEVKEGDVVLYGKFAGTEIEDNGEKFLILNQNDILATL